MPTLKSMTWHVGYSSDDSNLISSFYEPAMSAAKQYDRAVGYFSSHALALIAGGIQHLYLRNGTMRLIASPVLSEKDIIAIQEGYEQRDKMIEQRLLDFLCPSRLTRSQELRLQLLSGMIADGLLEVRIAVKSGVEQSLNLYHEKVGVFVDELGDYITFIGSPNESWNGWVGNIESFALHTSWGATSEHAHHERQLFEKTWNGNRSQVTMYEFPDAVRTALFEKYPPQEPQQTGVKGPTYRQPISFPSWLNGGGRLRPYQKEAVNRWLEAKGRGIFAMATGTGKTITALVAAKQLIEALHNKRALLILVVVPSVDLATQWKENAKEFGFQPVVCHSRQSGRWQDDLQFVLKVLELRNSPVEMVITTSHTMTSKSFSSLLSQYKGALLLIADEMHSLGTPRRINALPDAPYRLGLSATPQRHGDEEGTQELITYFGEVLQQISIKKAIEIGALVPYRYIPILVNLSEQEMEKYRELSRRIAALLGSHTNFDDLPDSAQFLLLERSRLLGHAEGKLQALAQLMKPLASSTHNLVYVAEGSHPIHGFRQMDRVIRLLGEEMKMNINTYDGNTPLQTRETYQAMLQDERLQALVAMRCLDEGIDIPEVRRGILLASTQNPRQFVQRRGRILRRDDVGGKTSAELYDMLVLPPSPSSKKNPSFRLERRLIQRELSRALELASASQNGQDVPPSELVKVMEDYDLLELLADYGTPPSWVTAKGDSNE